MNITVSTPPPPGIAERRRCTHAGVSGLKIELADGTQIKIEEEGESGITITSERTLSAVLHDGDEEMTHVTGCDRV